jgi:hypothetical protein
MTTLHVVTKGKPTSGRGKGRHGYGCVCRVCTAERCKLEPKVCQCDRPTTYHDEVTGDLRCLCGRAARGALGADLASAA